MVRRLLFASIALAAFQAFSPAVAAPGPGEPAPIPGVAATARWSRVDVAPTWTSIYIGTVSMRMRTFVRSGDTFSTAYTAKVFPYFFYNEQGTLTVTVTDAQLQALAGGKPIEFAGTAINRDGEPRKVTARATPHSDREGKLDVHVWVSKRIQLIFHTTYQFAGPA